MTKKLLIPLVVILQSLCGYSQSNFWSKVSEERVAPLEKSDRTNMPAEYVLYRLNFEAMKNVLETAPSRKDLTASNVVVYFPTPEGQMEKFVIYEASVLQPGLAAKYPGIKSYIGKGIDSPSTMIRFSTTLFGLHSMAFTTSGTYYIDTYTKDLQNYIVYNKTSLPVGSRAFSCETAGADVPAEFGAKFTPKNVLADDGVLRTYRLAMTCTYSYALFHMQAAGVTNGTTLQKKEAVLAAMNVTMTRVNGIYERDAAVTMEIIDGNDDIIFVTNGSDPFSSESGGVLLSEVQDVIDDGVGFSNYDIGHVVSTGGGGIAQLGCVCTSSKGRGVTGSPAPVGDSYDVDYVSHEMGHQFNATHTFNASGNGTGSCNGNRSQSTAVEPGSGTTIMGYAGICANADVQQHSDDYFHAASLAQIFNFIDNSATCAVETLNNNTPPVIDDFDSELYYIPASTAYVLRGSATDADGDALTYCWEQVDNNGSATTGPPTAISTTGPSYRSLSPTESSDRYMPKFSDVLANNFNSTWEVTPVFSRSLSFALTVRDNAVPNGGQTDRRDLQVSVLTGDPFKVTSQNLFGTTWGTGSTQTVTWDVSITADALINVSNVNILLSTDGGQTFEMLVENTPNDGSESFTVPLDTPVSTNCRVLVEAVGNIFYAVNLNEFTVSGTAGVEDFGLNGFTIYPNPNNGNFTVEFNSDSTNDINIAVYDMRGRQIFGNAYTNTGLFSKELNLQGVQSGVYLVNVQDGSRKEVKRIVVQ
ncbi:T9SS type A sorting domain-containing protein [Flavobacterium rakeshii]|uniref:T9SS type A sorting domain-containing protein n=1 Tax=Flavobacterium rakeshii TaxID=1038845 RepID=A0A6N8HGS8_9FLAO|nr:zinc-dependent metalloprotease family protein [Flavobacterium rakeshii]MUV04883.1 T9SS type A sorting domain-containing protein [Flavobacterium rakeshii]